MTSETDDETRGDDRDVDATGADADERDAKDELFEAIDHLKNAANILFARASKDPAVQTATKEAGKVAKQIGDAAEPIAKELTKEVGRLTNDVLGAVDRARTRRTRAAEAAEDADEEE